MISTGQPPTNVTLPVRPRHSLRWRLRILLGGVALITFLLISVGVYVFVFRTEQAAWQGRQREAAQNAGQTVAAFINRVEDSLALVGILDRAYLEAQPRVLRQTLEHEPALLELIRLDSTGRVFAGAYQEAPVLANLFTIPQSNWFLAALAGELYVGNVQISADDEPYLVMAVPALDGGVVAARLRMQVLWDVVAGIWFGETGGAYVIDRGGQVLAHPDSQVVLANTSIEGRPELAALLAAPDNVWNGAYQNFEGELVVGATVHVPDTDWIVITEQAQSESYAVSRAALLLLGGGVLLFGALLFWIGQRLIRRVLFAPLERLQLGAQRLGQGDLSQRIAIARQDEIGQVAGAFNRMAGELQSLYADMEAQVAARTEQLRISANVSRAAASILDPDRLLREIVNLITDYFNFYYAAIFILDESGRFAVLREAAGPDEVGRLLKQRGHKLEVGGQSMVGYATSQRRARIALDVGQEAVRFANPLLPETRSEIALPLLIGERVLGALDVQSKQEAAFDDASAATLQAMADQIAIALNNAALYAESQRNVKTLDGLLALSADIGRSRTLRDLTRRAFVHLEALLNAPNYYIALVDEHQTEIRFILQRRDDQSPDSQTVTRPFGSGPSLVEHVIRTRRTLRLSATESLKRLEQLGLTLPENRPRAFLGVPIQIGERVLGVVGLQDFSDTAAFSEDQERLAIALANQLAVTLDNLRLAEEAQRALADLDAANRLLTGQAWQRYAHRSGSLSGEWRGGQWTTSSDERGVEDAEVHLPTSNLQPPTSNLQPSTSSLKVPVKVRDQTIGEFDLLPLDPQQEWTADDVAFAQALVDQVGQAIEMARLLEETERLAGRERLINEINSRVRQTVSVDGILKAAVDELGRSLKAARVFAHIGEPATPGDLMPSHSGGHRGDDHA
jgi:GAF domain-containing protein/HAMP domain-containing protein